MAQIMLFHSVLGVRQGVLDAASQLQAMGHTVTVPNLYAEGVVFNDYEEAMKHVETSIGYAALIDRTREAARFLPQEMVYAGFSNGGVSAEYLAATRPGAQALILFASGMPLALYGQVEGADVGAWPGSIPVQVHYTIDDPFRDGDEVAGFERDVLAAGAPFTLHDYPGGGHLFTDPTLPKEYDEAATELLWRRVEAFLNKLG